MIRSKKNDNFDIKISKWLKYRERGHHLSGIIFWSCCLSVCPLQLITINGESKENLAGHGCQPFILSIFFSVAVLMC